MLKTIVTAIDDDNFFTGHPWYDGPYSNKNKNFKVGDKIYFSSAVNEWVKDNVIKAM